MDISVFAMQMAIVLTLTNLVVNALKPLWQAYEWQSKMDLGVGFTVSIGLCVIFHVDGIALLSAHFPDALQIPWWVGAIVSGLLGEKLAALLQDLSTGKRGLI